MELLIRVPRAGDVGLYGSIMKRQQPFTLLRVPPSPGLRWLPSTIVDPRPLGASTEGILFRRLRYTSTVHRKLLAPREGIYIIQAQLSQGT